MNRQYAAGAAALLAIIAVLVWMFWPPAEVEVAEATPDDAADEVANRKVTKLVPVGEAASDEPLPLEEDPSIPVVTKTCKWIVTDERRNVPQWVMLDNLRDRGQLFVEDDLRCLTAAGVTPAILDFAERYQDQNALRGRVGTPYGG